MQIPVMTKSSTQLVLPPHTLVVLPYHWPFTAGMATVLTVFIPTRTMQLLLTYAPADLN